MEKSRSLRAFFSLSLVITCLISSSYAAPTSKNDAMKAVKGWLKATDRPLKAKMSKDILNVSEYKNASGDTIYYVVNMTPVGYVIVSPDDLIEPIIAFSKGGHYVAASENPMHSMLQKDLPNRLKHIKELKEHAKNGFIPNASLKKSQSKWKTFTGDLGGFTSNLSTSEEPLPVEPQAAPPASIDDVRVDVLLETTWNQGGFGGDYLYNYYTPEHLVCGCVATTLAQILRHFKHPTVGIGQITSTACSVNGVNTHLTTRGGDGLGGPYDWDNMPGIPDASITVAQRQAIGALLYDAGVVCNMSYGPTSYSSNNNAKYALRNEFQYGNAIQGSYPDAAKFATRANSNLEAGKPCMVEVPGHSIVVDGYGYNSGTMYHHFNMGWGGGANGWYNVPNVYTYDTIVSITFNIFVSGTGELISGRVKNALGLPQAGITVTADDGQNQYTDISDAEGNYGIQVPSNTTFTVSCQGAAPKVLTTGTSSDYSNCGNHWGQDFTCNNGAQVFYTPTTFNESILNNGTITNSISITLYDDTFTGSIGADISGNVTVTNLPTGLTAQFIKASDTQLTVSLTDNAVSHGLADDVNNLTFSFQNSAFAGGDASSVVDSTKSDLVIDFHDTTQALPYAVDAPSLTWTTGGSAEWFYQTDITHDGEDAGKSGVITHNQSTYMQTTVVGPGTLTFWWKVDSEANYDWLRVYIDGGEQAKISGDIDWELKTFNISAGTHVIKWEYKKDGSRSIPDDCAWVDEVVFSPDYVSYAVTYDGNGNTGGLAPNSQTKIEGVDLTLASNSGNLTKSAFTFAGWNTAADGNGTDYSEGATYSTDADLTLYAKWTTLPTYTVTYAGNGNSGGTAPPNQTKIEGVDLPLASNTGLLVKAGYAFVGWNTVADGSGTDYTEGATYTVDADLDLFAKWSYTGTYPIAVANHSFEEGADGSGSAVNKAPWQKAGTGSNLISIQELSGIPGKADPAPDATDTTHYTNGTGDNIYQVLGTTLAANTTYTLSVDVGDRSDLTVQPGSIRLGYVSVSPTSNDDYGLNLLTATIVNNAIPVNGAAADDGWETWVSTFTTGDTPAGLGQSLRIELVTDAGVQTLWDNVRLDGGAAVVEYSVTYNGNGNTGGSVTVDSNSYQESDTVTVLGNTGNLVKSGNTFTGWNTAANGTGTSYSGGSTFSMGTSNVTLYAQWTADPTFTLTVTNGTGDGDYIAGANASITADAPQQGYRFSNWTTADGGTFADANSSTTTYMMPANAAEVIANYVLNNPPVVDAGPDQTVPLSGQNVPWTPAGIATMAAWYDAADADTLWADTAGTTPATTTVARWDDKSGSGISLREGTNKPSLGTFNGRNVMSFQGVGGSDQYLVATAGIPTAAQFFAVTRYTAVESNRPTLVGDSLQNAHFIQLADDDLNGVPDRFNGTPGYINAESTTGAATQLADPCLIRTNRTISNSNLSLGKDRGSNNRCFDGFIAEIVIFDTLLPLEEQQKLEGYLAWKWGLEGNLPVDHPYVDAAPMSATAQTVVDLNGTVSDADVGDSVTTSWSLVSTVPAGLSVTFGDTSAVDTTATFTAEGVYTLRLTADDGIDQTSDDMVITIGSTGTPIVDVNLPAGISLYGYTGENPIDAQAAFQTLISNNQLSLVRWVNPGTGQIKELYYTTFPSAGWVNEIGDLTLGQGYVVKTTEACTLSVSGNKSTASSSIDLPSGYSIIGFNQETPLDAQAAFQPLIDAGKLDLIRWVNPSNGQIKELYYTTFPSAGWVNEIGDLFEGQGYIIKLNTAHTGFTLP